MRLVALERTLAAQRRETMYPLGQEDAAKKPGPAGVGKGVIQDVLDIERLRSMGVSAKKIGKAEAHLVVEAHGRQARAFERAVYRDERPGRTLLERRQARKARETFGLCVSRIARLVGGLSGLFAVIDRMKSDAASGLESELTVDEAEALAAFEACAEEIQEREKAQRATGAIAGGGVPAAALAALAIL